MARRAQYIINREKVGKQKAAQQKKAEASMRRSQASINRMNREREKRNKYNREHGLPEEKGNSLGGCLVVIFILIILGALISIL